MARLLSRLPDRYGGDSVTSHASGAHAVPSPQTLTAALPAQEAAEQVPRFIDAGLRTLTRVRDQELPAAVVAISGRQFQPARDHTQTAKMLLASAEGSAREAERLVARVDEVGYRTKLQIELRDLYAQIEALKPAVADVVRRGPPAAESHPELGLDAEEWATIDALEAQAENEWSQQRDDEDAQAHADAGEAPIPEGVACAVTGPKAARPFSGIKLYIQVKDHLPKADRTHPAHQVGPGRVGPYMLLGHVKDDQLVYFVAYHSQRAQNEWVIGPDDMDDFVANAPLYIGAARTALPGSPEVGTTTADGADGAVGLPPSMLEQEAFGTAPFQMHPLDGMTETNGGSAIVGFHNTHVRLRDYVTEAERLSQQLKLELATGEIDHMAARNEAVMGRNHLLVDVRGQLSPSGRFASEMIKSDDAISVEKMTAKKTRDLLDGAVDSDKQLARLSEDSDLWAKYALALKAGDDAQAVYADAVERLGAQPAVSHAIIDSAGKNNRWVTGLAKTGRIAAAAGAVYGTYTMVKTILGAEEGQRLHVAANEFAAFTGGVLGAEAGTVGALWVASLLIPNPATPAIIIVSLIGGALGAGAGASLGPSALGFASGAVQDSMQAVAGPGMAQNGGYNGLYDRSRRDGLKDVEDKVADAIFASDEAIAALEAEIAKAADREQLEQLQRLRLQQLAHREYMGQIYGAMRVGVIDQQEAGAMLGTAR